MDEQGVATVTLMLQRWRDGDKAAIDELFPIVYDELRRLAAGQLRGERRGHTLQPTALVHEAFMRLTEKSRPGVSDRAHLLAVSAQAMRRVLVDHARRDRAGKRIGAADRVPLLEIDEPQAPAFEVDVLDLHAALQEFGQINSRQCRVVELRYFGGLTNDEISEVLGISRATVERDWTVARLWLRQRLEEPSN